MRRLLSLWIILSSIGFASAADDMKFVAVDLQPHATQKRFDGLDNQVEKRSAGLYSISKMASFTLEAQSSIATRERWRGSVSAPNA